VRPALVTDKQEKPSLEAKLLMCTQAQLGGCLATAAAAKQSSTKSKGMRNHKSLPSD